MTAPEHTLVDWNRSIKSIWAERLASVATRDRGDTALPGAWSLAAAAATQGGWEIRAVVPLLQDPHGHRWAVVLGRGDEHPAPNLVLIHGATPALALARSIAELEAGIQIPAFDGPTVDHNTN